MRAQPAGGETSARAESPASGADETPAQNASTSGADETPAQNASASKASWQESPVHTLGGSEPRERIHSRASARVGCMAMGGGGIVCESLCVRWTGAPAV